MSSLWSSGPWPSHFTDELFDFASLASERIDFDGLSVWVVTPEMLYRMKKGTVRPKDWGDAQRLAHRFGLKE